MWDIIVVQKKRVKDTRRIVKGRSLTVLPWQLSLFEASTVWLSTVRRSFCVGWCLTIGVWLLVCSWEEFGQTLMPITGAPGRQYGGVWICIDSRVCMLVSALSVWTAVLDHTKLFGVGWASKIDRIPVFCFPAVNDGACASWASAFTKHSPLFVVAWATSQFTCLLFNL